MREHWRWRDRRGLARSLEEEWAPSGDDLGIADVLDAELGLYLLEAVAPAERPAAVWALLGGYPIAEAAGYQVDASLQQMIRVARALLPTRRAPHDWATLITRYARVPEHVRGYLIAADGSGFTRR